MAWIRRLWTYAVVIAVAVAATAATTLMVVLPQMHPRPSPAEPPGVTNLTSIQLTFVYLNDTPPVYGPNIQEGCSNCPVGMDGGSIVSVWVPTTINRSVYPNSSVTWWLAWLNYSSPIPVQELDCVTPPASYGGVNGCPFVTSYVAPEDCFERDLGQFDVPLSFAIPNPVPEWASYGFEAQVSITVLALTTPSCP